MSERELTDYYANWKFAVERAEAAEARLREVEAERDARKRDYFSAVIDAQDAETRAQDLERALLRFSRLDPWDGGPCWCRREHDSPHGAGCLHNRGVVAARQEAHRLGETIFDLGQRIEAAEAEVERLRDLAARLDEPHTDDDWEVVKASVLTEIRAALGSPPAATPERCDPEDDGGYPGQSWSRG